MSIEIAYVVAGTMIFTGFIVGGGIIYSGLKKVANALIKKWWITLNSIEKFKENYSFEGSFLLLMILTFIWNKLIILSSYINSTIRRRKMNKRKRKYIIFFVSSLVILLTIYFTMNNSKSNNYAPVNEVNLNDFNFRLNFNTYGKEQIDTYKKTYTKDLIIDGTKTIDFTIADSTKKEIYNLMVEVDILSIPDILTVEGIEITPSCDYSLKVTINGKTKNIVWNEGFYTSTINNIPKDNVNFLKIVKYISDYIHNTNEYKSMPKSNGGYD